MSYSSLYLLYQKMPYFTAILRTQLARWQCRSGFLVPVIISNKNFDCTFISTLNLYHLNFWLFYIRLSYYSQLNHLVLGLNWMVGWFSTMLLSASWSAFFPLGFLLTCHVFLFSLYISTYIFTSISSDFFFFSFRIFLFE